MNISRRLFFSVLACFGIIPNNLPGKLEIKETTNFLIPYQLDDGSIGYDTNVFGEYYKLIATYKEENPININKSQYLRFKSKRIYKDSPTERDRLYFKRDCLRSLARNKLKFVSEIANEIIV